MTHWRREDIEYIIKVVADAAWGIAANLNAPPLICLRIEDLSDDSETNKKLVDGLMEDLNKLPLPAAPSEPTAEGREARPGWLVCSVCGDPTDMGCSDCRINYRTTVYVCGKRECRAHHESKCYGDGDLRADLARMKAALEKCREALVISTGYVFEELLNEIDAALKGTSP